MDSDVPAMPPGLPTTPPAAATLPSRHPQAPTPGSAIGNHYPLCFGCGLSHPTGLHMRVRAGQGLDVTAEMEVTDNHQGAPGLAHGGLLAAACDEALGALNWLLQTPAVTGRLETDFRRPVPVGAVLHLRAEIVGVLGRKVFTRGVARLDGPTGPVAVVAAALFIQVSLEHFVQNGREQDVQRVAMERAAGHGPFADVFEVNP